MWLAFVAFIPICAFVDSGGDSMGCTDLLFSTAPSWTITRPGQRPSTYIFCPWRGSSHGIMTWFSYLYHIRLLLPCHFTFLQVAVPCCIVWRYYFFFFFSPFCFPASLCAVIAWFFFPYRFPAIQKFQEDFLLHFSRVFERSHLDYILPSITELTLLLTPVAF